MHRWCLLNLTVQGFSLNLTVRGVSNKHCLLTFFHFFRFRVKGTKKNKYKSSENDQLTGHFQSFFFFLIQSFFFLSPETGEPTVFKHFIIYLKIWTGQSLLKVSLSKIHGQNLKNIFF